MSTNWLQKRLARQERKFAPQPRPTFRPRLEELEDRLTPTPFSATYTNAVVNVTPNLMAGTVTEQVTANVTNAPTYTQSTNTVNPVPAGAAAPTSGTVLFRLNNMQQSAQLDGMGQASATFTLPLFAVLASQGLQVHYQGNTVSGGTNFGSFFEAELYMNYDNLLFPATLTFGQLTPQQLYTSSPTDPTTHQATAFDPPTNTIQGETDSIGPLSFDYTDPGTINTVGVFGMTLPGILAMRLDAYGPQFSGQSK